VLPVGKIEEETLTRVILHLESVFKNCKLVKIRGEESILQDAYNGARHQYDSKIILENLAKTVKAPTPADKLLAILSVDLYTGGLNFIFGQAQYHGQFAVVSTYRLKPEFYGGEDGALLLRRLEKEAVHELGHTFGLSHCANPTCVMSFSNSIRMVDRKDAVFCQSCRSHLHINM